MPGTDWAAEISTHYALTKHRNSYDFPYQIETSPLEAGPAHANP